jgi:hypothetical protein
VKRGTIIMRFILICTMSALLAATLAAQQVAPPEPVDTDASSTTPAAGSLIPPALAAGPSGTAQQVPPIAATETEDGEFEAGSLRGRIENGRYYAPSDAFNITIPALAGDRPLILDNPNIVVFRDDVRTMLTVAAVRMEPIHKWELETSSPREFLIRFFRENVLADFQETFPGTSVEGAIMLNDFEGGALLVSTLHPNGSAFEVDPIVRNDPNSPPPVAKRGSLLFSRGGFVFVLSTELADRVTESSTYITDTATEDRILRERLVEAVSQMRFADSPPETAQGSPPEPPAN